MAEPSRFDLVIADSSALGSLGVLVLAKKQGLVTSIRPKIELLRSSELFLAESLLSKALELAGEALAP